MAIRKLILLFLLVLVMYAYPIWLKYLIGFIYPHFKLVIAVEVQQATCQFTQVCQVYQLTCSVFLAAWHASIYQLVFAKATLRLTKCHGLQSYLQSVEVLHGLQSYSKAYKV